MYPNETPKVFLSPETEYFKKINATTITKTADGYDVVFENVKMGSYRANVEYGTGMGCFKEDSNRVEVRS